MTYVGILITRKNGVCRFISVAVKETTIDLTQKKIVKNLVHLNFYKLMFANSLNKLDLVETIWKGIFSKFKNSFEIQFFLCQNLGPQWQSWPKMKSCFLHFSYYFDSSDGTCKLFYYGGCEGNKNNFKTLQSCQSRCSVDFSIPIEEEFKLEFCFLAVNEGTK